MLCTANRRSRYYLSALLKNGFLPAFLLILDNPSRTTTPGQTASDSTLYLVDFAREHGIPHEIIKSLDINGAEVVKNIRSRPEIYFIYSGPGGAILRDEVLSLGKKFIHVHPGQVPGFKGSTTIYYQILTEGHCSASAIFMEKKIDSGPLLAVQDFPCPGRSEDWDYDYDPRIRSEVLLKLIKDYAKTGTFREMKKEELKSETYYIAHPVIRHIARIYGESIQKD